MMLKTNVKYKDFLQKIANSFGYTITKSQNVVLKKGGVKKTYTPPAPKSIIVSEISGNDSRVVTIIESIKSKGGTCFASSEKNGFTISILEENLDLLLLTLDRYFSESHVFLISRNGDYLNKSNLIDAGILDREFSIAFINNTPGHKQAVAINFVIWRKINHYERRDIYESGYPLLAVRRAKLETLLKISNDEINLEKANETISPSFDVDIVYTWVNDKDDSWKRARDLYKSNNLEQQDKFGSRANLDERFNNRDELKYSLRSIEYYAKFVRNIYIVTNGQIPNWLDTSNPKIRIVTHSELYPSNEVLPTFNSSSIETVLHRIDGISENFIYFNDDFLLGSRTTRHDFFSKEGRPKYFKSQQTAFIEDIDQESEEYIKADKNAMLIMKKSFGLYSGDIMQHAPYPCKVSLLKKYESDYVYEYNACRVERFRSEKDIRPIAFMQANFGQISGDCVEGNISHQYIPLWRSNLNKRLNEILSQKKHKTICINDVGVSSDAKEAVDKSVFSFLESYYPVKSGFEK